MPPRCSICTSKDRKAIDADLAEGASYPQVASRYSVSVQAIGRHQRAGHVLERVAKSAEVAEVASADTLLAKVTALEERVRRIGEEAAQDGDRRTAIMAAREEQRIIEFQGRLSGEVTAAGTVVNVNQQANVVGTVIKVEYPDDEQRPDSYVEVER